VIRTLCAVSLLLSLAVYILTLIYKSTLFFELNNATALAGLFVYFMGMFAIRKRNVGFYIFFVILLIIMASAHFVGAVGDLLAEHDWVFDSTEAILVADLVCLFLLGAIDVIIILLFLLYAISGVFKKVTKSFAMTNIRHKPKADKEIPMDRSDSFENEFERDNEKEREKEQRRAEKSYEKRK